MTPRGTTLDPPQRRQRTLDAVKRLLLRESQVQPLLLVFEDLHWIDAETQALLDGLVESLPDGARSCSSSTTGPSTARLGRQDLLPPAAAGSVAARERRRAARARCSGTDRALEPLKRGSDRADRGKSRSSSRRASGRSSRPGRWSVSGAPTGWRRRRDACRSRRPSRPSWPARIDRLAPEEKRLLQAAAVIGKDVPFPLLQAVADLAERAAPEAGSSPGRRVPLRDAPLSGPRVHVQARAHPRSRLRQPAPGSPACAPCRDREAIERLYADRLAEQSERLAYHALRGEDWDKAVQYRHAAGNERSRGRPTARRRVPRAGAGGARATAATARRAMEQAIDLRLRLHGRHAPLGGPSRSADQSRWPTRCAEGLDDPRRSVGRRFTEREPPGGRRQPAAVLLA